MGDRWTGDMGNSEGRNPTASKTDENRRAKTDGVSP